MSQLSRKLLAVTLILAIGTLWVGEARAASDTAEGHVSILTPISVTNTQAMDFAGIIAPTSGSQDFTMNASTGVVTAGAGDGDIFGSPSAASFTVGGTESQAITSSVVVTTDFSNASLTLGTLTTAGDTSTIPGGGSGTITVGGTLNVASGIAAGSYTDAVITLTVHYQ